MVTYKLVNNVVSQFGKTEGVGEGLAAGLKCEFGPNRSQRESAEEQKKHGLLLIRT